MAQITTVGIDLAKHVFSLHGVDHAGHVVLRKTVRAATGASEESEAGNDPRLEAVVNGGRRVLAATRHFEEPRFAGCHEAADIRGVLIDVLAVIGQVDLDLQAARRLLAVIRLL